jgi:imidazolonepropionase-like amidohydrolase
VAAHRVFIIPTLSTELAVCGNPQGPALIADSLLAPYIAPRWHSYMSTPRPMRGGPFSCEGTLEALRQVARRNVPILAGTDAPGMSLTYGAAMHAELRLLVESGLTPVQALTAATAAAARAFRLEDRGRIAEGLRADLVLVEGDPTVRIMDSRRIVTVWKRGTPVERRRYP